MIWTNDDTKALQKWINYIDSDDIKIKEKIKNELVKNKNIIHVLHNEELERQDASPGDYYGINILPYYNIEPTQTHVENFICFETQWIEEQSIFGQANGHRHNKYIKLQQVVFYILCHIKNIQDQDTMLARHDLLAALITDQFNWTNIFGCKAHCVSSKPSTVDNNYVARTLVFEQDTYNNLVKSTKTGEPRLANKDIVLETEYDDSEDDVGPESA